MFTAALCSSKCTGFKLSGKVNFCSGELGNHCSAQLSTCDWKINQLQDLRIVKLLPYRRLITAVFVACVLSAIPYVVSADYSQSSVTQLIDDLTQIDSQSPGINSATIYEGFIADNTPGSFQGGVLGVAPPKVPPQMSELVRRGPHALPELLKHLDDRRPTKLGVGEQ
jgi:hypothetical protein